MTELWRENIGGRELRSNVDSRVSPADRISSDASLIDGVHEEWRLGGAENGGVDAKGGRIGEYAVVGRLLGREVLGGLDEVLKVWNSEAFANRDSLSAFLSASNS